ELYARPRSREVASFIGRSTLVAASDRGTTASAAIGGVTRDFVIEKPMGTPHAVTDGYVVLRPESLRLIGPESPGSWPGRIVGRRFAGATTVYRVELSDAVTVETASPLEWSE